MFLYLKYITYGFIIYLAYNTVLYLYNKYLCVIFIRCGIMRDKKKIQNKNEINELDRVEILKDKFKIKSTENTLPNLKFILVKPSHFNSNNIISDSKFVDKLLNNSLVNNEFNTLPNNKKITGLVRTYMYNKYLFKNLFQDSNGLKIKDLGTFYDTHKKYIEKKEDNMYNILLKFYNDDLSYLYIFVNNSNLIKIKKYDEYNKICDLIESGNNIFLIRDDKNIHYVTHCSYIKHNINQEQIKSVFFKNIDQNNKNFKILSKFGNIAIYFYVSTKIEL